jgi:protoporphyrinogen oxidase
MASYGIVGGGILGLTLALRLRQRGHDVTVFEAAAEIGGLASAWQIGPVTWDRHYHVMLYSDLSLRKLLDELGLSKECIWRETRTGFYTDGQFYSMSNAWEFLRFPPLRWIDKFRLALTILRASRVRDPEALEAIPVVDWLRKWSGRRVVDKIWLPLLRAKLGNCYEDTSAAFIWATIARMYAARKAGFKKEFFGYVRGGYARILQRFAEHLQKIGVTIETCMPVRQVRTGCLEFHDQSVRHFDKIVVTAAAPLAAQICPDLEVMERARLLQVRYLGIVCASLLLRQPLGPFYVTNITEDWVPFTGVIEMTALVDPSDFNHLSLIYLPKYVSPNDPLFEEDDTTIQQRLQMALARMYPHFQASDVVACRVSRVRHVFALSTLGYSQIVPPMTSSLPGVYFVNSSHIVHGTLNVNETVQLAERAVAVVEGGRSHVSGRPLVEGAPA